MSLISGHIHVPAFLASTVALIQLLVQVLVAMVSFLRNVFDLAVWCCGLATSAPKLASFLVLGFLLLNRALDDEE